jgi:two-component system chemotaxis response regulator CheB
MPSHEIVVIGASRGGIEALCEVIEVLPKRFAGAVFVVVHIGEASLLPTVLERCGSIKVLSPRDRQRVERGVIYVAPPNRHMLLRDGTVALSHGPHENRHRPAIDPLFRSAARLYRSRVIGVVLSGALDDGTAGLFAVKSKGGLAIVQDPSDAAMPDMPRNAMKHTTVDYCLPAKKIGKVLTKLVGVSGPKTRSTISPPRGTEKTKVKSNGELVPVTCPECHGPITISKNGKLIKFECEVGHVYSPESFTEAHTDALERALWIALRTLKERVSIQQTLARAERARGETHMANRFAETAASAERDIALLREIVERI